MQNRKPYNQKTDERFDPLGRSWSISLFESAYYGWAIFDSTSKEQYGKYDLIFLDQDGQKRYVEAEVKQVWDQGFPFPFSDGVDYAGRKRESTVAEKFPLFNKRGDCVYVADKEVYFDSPVIRKNCTFDNKEEDTRNEPFIRIPFVKLRAFRLDKNSNWVEVDPISGKRLDSCFVVSEHTEIAPHLSTEEVISPQDRDKNKQFIHWHCHSEYSALDGLSKMTELVMEARKMGFPAMAITDHGTVGGWIKFIQECAKTKDREGKSIPYDPITPILGEEFYLARNHEYKNKELQPDGKRGNRHLNIFARNWKGYQNLCRLSQKAWVDGQYYQNPRIDLDLLAEHSDGLMVGTACLSSLVNANLLYDRYDVAKKVVAKFKDIFGDHFFLEVMYHGIDEEGAIIPRILQLSKDMDVPVVATGDVHYIYKHQAKSQEVLMCMNTSRCVNDENRIHFPYDEFYLKSAREMASIFGDAPQVMTNSLVMLEHIDHKDIESNLFGHQRMPTFHVPPPFEKPIEYLRHLVMDGAQRMGYVSSETHMQEIEKELSDIAVAKENSDLDFDAYFLIIWDIVSWAKKQGIMVGSGRGSGFASLVLRCLGVCYGPDPQKYGLLWERFLGFDNERFVSEKDFGFAPIVGKLLVDKDLDLDLDEDRELEDDLGGVDRY